MKQIAFFSQQSVIYSTSRVKVQPGGWIRPALAIDVALKL